jgi:hypothetical protein
MKAVLAFHRWFMKYSGTTMIIDNIEERRRRRQSEEHSEVKDSPVGSAGLVLGSTEENKKVLG